MLNDSDLDEFIRCVRRVECETTPQREERPDTVLLAQESSGRLLHPNELWRLHRSLRITSFADNASEFSSQILDVIVRKLTVEDRRYLPPSHSDEWLSAIRWAAARGRASNERPLRPRHMDRQLHVGTACRRLRDRGYRVHVGVYGPRLDDETRLAIAQRVDSLIARIGGIAAAQGICGLMGVTGKIHDQMWLLGHRPGAPDRAAEPAIPIGWLLALALRHIHTRPSKTDPTEEWKLAADLAIDFAAAKDCQRYNQWDGFNLEATDFLQSLEESLAWRELFMLPQVPPIAVATIRRAFAQITWPEETDDLRSDVDDLFAEVDNLLPNLSVDRLTEIPASQARAAFPRLWRHARAPRGATNAQYLDPFGDHPCDHDRFVFFEPDDERVVLLPPALTAAAACVAIFTSVRERTAKAKADCIVGAVMEKAISIGCRAHTDCVQEAVTYKEGKEPLEIDVAVREGPELILFEAKSKPLTANARTGDMMAFLLDYTKSFLALVRQLIRHERNIRAGLTPLARATEEIDSLRISKVAISPLCYGPSSDHVQAGSLFRAIVKLNFDAMHESTY